MPTIQGVGGLVALPANFTAKFNAWTADLIIETFDTSGFTDNGYRTRDPVIISMDGTASGIGDDTTTPAPGTMLAATADLSLASATMTLTAQGGNTYAFTGTINNVNYSRPVAGALELTFSFQSSGAITQAWA